MKERNFAGILSNVQNAVEVVLTKAVPTAESELCSLSYIK
jgi:hypothetical protein